MMLWLLLFSWDAYSQGFYQKRRYIDVGVGSSGYLGDLTSTSSLFSSHSLLASGSVGLAVDLNPFVWVRGSLGWYRLQAQDIDSKNDFDYTRNLHFRNDMVEFSLTGNLDLLGEKHYFKPGKYKPYILAGLSFFYSNPRARTPESFGGSWTDLRPLGTEGQNLGIKKRYSPWNFALPLGFGVDFQLTKNWDITTEFAWRITTTDYLDDVSAKYVNLNAFGDNKLAAALSDRSAEERGGFGSNPRSPKLPEHKYDNFVTHSGFSHPQNPDNKRGDNIPFDSYFSFQIRLKYTLPLTKRQLNPKHDFPYAKEIGASDWVYLPKIYGRFEIELAKINTAYSEIACAFMGNQFLFASDVPRTRFFKPKPFHKFYYRYYLSPIADLSRNELTKALIYADKTDEQKDFFTASYLSLENEVYFAAYNNFKSNAVEGIYKSLLLENGALGKSEAVVFPDFNGEPSEGFVHPDGSSLYFTAYNEKTKRDIYISFRDSLGWTTPLRLPYPINTEHNDLYPTVHRDGTLYFSSDRPGGFGKIDIYEVVNQDIISPEVTLLPSPINSTSDDFGLILDTYKRFGVFTSNRTGGVGEEDIYMLRINELSKSSRLLSDTTNLQKSQQVILIGQVRAADGTPISGAIVKRLDILNDAVDITFTDAYGLYSFLLTNDSDYKIGVSAQGFEPASDTLLATISMDLNKPEIELNFSLQERVVLSKLYGNLINKGNPIANAKVFLKNLKTEALQETTTGANGYYEFSINSKHTHLVIIQAEGFKPSSFKINSSSSEYSENLRYNITLEPIAD